MHNGFGMDDTATKRLSYTLMSETNAQQRQFSLKMMNNINGNAGFIGSTGTGRDYNPRRIQVLDFLQCYFIISINMHVFTQLTKILYQVVGEGIVIVYH